MYIFYKLKLYYFLIFTKNYTYVECHFYFKKYQNNIENYIDLHNG